MKHFLIISVLAVQLFLVSMNESNEADASKSTFELSISTFNHAENGWMYPTTYRIKDNKLKVIRRDNFKKKETVIYSKTIVVDKISATDLSGLESHYFNNCIMTTSGTEYFIYMKTGSSTKEISLHHYYVDEIARLASEIDRQLPEKYKINYLPKDNEQNCQ